LQPITNEIRYVLHEEVLAMARRGLRTLAIAYRRLPKDGGLTGLKNATEEARNAALGTLLDGAPYVLGDDASATGAESELTLLGLFGLADPLREGVTEALALCNKAGIRVMMVTGDHKDTASHIARECGILKPELGQEVMEGPQFRQLSDEDRVKVCSKLAVLARSSPTDKHLLVKTLKEMGEIVAVTGDGTNDAPALRAADVGLAMGIAGTEVAKEASDIVILDDRFSSIVASVRWGRSIKENIRKFLTFQLTINIVALTLTFVTACANGGDTETNFPITAVQLLWLNLIMDSFAALALATEPPSDSLMEYPPQGKDEPLITNTMFKNMIGHAIFQAALLLFLTTMPAKRDAFFEIEAGNKYPNTAVFTAFVALQVFNLFNCRAVHDEWNVPAGFSSSVIAQFIIGVICVMQVILVQFGGDFFQTAPLTVPQWLKCVAVGSSSIIVGIVIKIVTAAEAQCQKLRRGMYTTVSLVLSCM
jgi:Ca2+-transporting ATPase